MQQFTIQAGSVREAFEKMKREYGEDAVILSHRSIRVGGVLGLFARKGVEIKGYAGRRGGRQAPGSGVRTQPVPLPVASESATGEASLSRRKDEVLDAILRYSGKTREQIRRPAADVSSEILKEIKELKASLQERTREAAEAPSIEEVGRLLRRNEFTQEYIDRIKARIRASFSVDQLDDTAAVQDAVLEWIGEGIQIAPPPTLKPGVSLAFIVVGPTGVGKTTTIAKLSAKYGLGNGGRGQKNVRIVTIDSYRIGAREQIETYAEIMQIPVSFVETYEDLKKVIDLYQGVDLILVDTIGKSPKDSVSLAKMKKILEACGHQCETHLALSATTKTNDLAEVLQQFEPFDYSGVILTKLDETSYVGNVLSVLQEKGKAVSFITTGQRVPQDIERATKMRLLMNLDGFHVSRERLQERLGERDHDDDTLDWS